MLLSGAVFALFMTGFWLYCLTDAILTPASECRGLSKGAWVVIITVTFIGGAIAWLVARPPMHRSFAAPSSDVPSSDISSSDGPSSAGPSSAGPLLPPSLRPGGSSGDAGFLSERWSDEDDAVARHPAGRARTTDATYSVPKGPDDDEAFLRALDRVIRGNFQAGEEV